MATFAKLDENNIVLNVIRVSDSVFAKLQSHAEPFIDTPSSVIVSTPSVRYV